jgi:septal ring factor EnvC (AmiA/AmiB activator)
LWRQNWSIFDLFVCLCFFPQAITSHQQAEERLKKTKKNLAKAIKDVDTIQAKLSKMMQQEDRTATREEIQQVTDKLMKAESVRRSLEHEVRQRRQDLIQAFGVRDQTIADAARDFRELERKVTRNSFPFHTVNTAL